MIKNYLKIALRNFYREKLHSFINIFGLAIGLAATFLIFIYVQHELSYDRFNDHPEHIYRFLETMSRPGKGGNTYPININQVGPEVKEQFPQVEEFVRLKPKGKSYIDYEQKRVTDVSTLYADSTFFKMFDYELIRGNPEEVLADPRGAVITQKLATKMFGDEDPVGQVIQVAQEKQRVTGVMKSFPANSHLKCDMVLSLTGMPLFNEMGSLEYATYIKLDPAGDHLQVRKKIASLSDQLINERFEGSGYEVKSRLQKLTDIHLRSGYLQHDYGTNGDIQKVYMYIFLAVVILVVAIINYLNLFTARAENRTKEVGLRKVVGASRTELMKQFLGESVLTTFISLIIALGLVELLISNFGAMLGRELSTGYFQDPIQLLVVLGVATGVGLLAGYYPAFYLTRFNVVRIFRGGEGSGRNKSLLTVSLVVAQFIIAIFLLASVIIFNKQIRYMKDKDLGFNQNQVLLVGELSEKLKGSYSVIEQQLLSNPRIESVTSAQTMPGRGGRSGQSVWKVGSSKSAGIAIKENRVNYGYVETMGIRVKEGRSFSRDFSDEASSFMVNEKACEMLGLHDPVGQKLTMGFREGTVIGVVENYHFTSLKYAVEPLLLTMYQNPWNKSHCALRIKPREMGNTIDFVEKTLQEVDPNYTLSYTFLDDQFDRLYRSEERSSKLVGFATGLSIIIAFLGLFALTSFSIVKRTKEIGIRKAMGASQVSIMRLFTVGMLKWIVVASLIAFPLILFFMNQWLQDFSYRIEIQVWMLLVSALGAALVAVVTTSTLTVRAANTNPAETLRDE